jgi:lysophospholipase L1-like esterase
MIVFYRMRFFSIVLVFLMLWASLSAAQNIDPKVKRIIFLGNSITWQANYVNDVIAYLTVRYPNRHFEFINVGLPSETVSGLSEPGHAGGAFPRPDLHERLQRVLDQSKPDLVFACYGMNDGIYMPFDEDRFQKFKDGILWLHNEVVKSGADIIHITPPFFDELRGGDPGYAAVLDRYAKWLLGLRHSAGYKVIDVHFPMKKYLDAHRRVDAKFNLDGFALTTDGVHPGELGHWIMAREILLYLGCAEVAMSPGIEQALSGTPNAAKLLKLITDRQNLLRDAWLTATKYKRPGLPVGLSLDEATKQSDAMSRSIDSLLQR